MAVATFWSDLNANRQSAQADPAEDERDALPQPQPNEDDEQADSLNHLAQMDAAEQALLDLPTTASAEERQSLALRAASAAARAAIDDAKAVPNVAHHASVMATESSSAAPSDAEEKVAVGAQTEQNVLGVEDLATTQPSGTKEDTAKQLAALDPAIREHVHALRRINPGKTVQQLVALVEEQSSSKSDSPDGRQKRAWWQK